MQKNTFDCVEDFEKAVSALMLIEPRFREAIAASDAPKFKRPDAGFEALFKIIVGQQLSNAAAKSIWLKLHAGNLTQRKILLSADEATLRSFGLSKAKISYAKALASSNIKYDLLTNKLESEIIQELTAVRGIGVWTAQVYLMFSLRRIDVFATGDLALKEGVRILFDLETRPSSNELACLSNRWTPYRTIAALILWKYYNHSKRRRK